MYTNIFTYIDNIGILCITLIIFYNFVEQIKKAKKFIFGISINFV